MSKLINRKPGQEKPSPLDKLSDTPDLSQEELENLEEIKKPIHLANPQQIRKLHEYLFRLWSGKFSPRRVPNDSEMRIINTTLSSLHEMARLETDKELKEKLEAQDERLRVLELNSRIKVRG